MYLKENYQIYYIVGKNVKKYRQEKKITQQELAKKCGYSNSYIKKIEGKGSPKNFSLLTIYNISKALDIDIKCLFEGSDI